MKSTAAIFIPQLIKCYEWFLIMHGINIAQNILHGKQQVYLTHDHN